MLVGKHFIDERHFASRTIRFFFLVLISVFSVYKFKNSLVFNFLSYVVRSSSIPSTIHSMSLLLFSLAVFWLILLSLSSPLTYSSPLPPPRFPFPCGKVPSLPFIAVHHSIDAPRLPPSHPYQLSPKQEAEFLALLNQHLHYSSLHNNLHERHVSSYLYTCHLMKLSNTY